MKQAIRVVVVDDSPFVCRLLTLYLQSAGDVQVVATALNGARAVELVRELRPDAVTLDLEMPGMGGLDVLDQLMRETPAPVVVVSAVSRKAAQRTLQALERGAVDFVLKYTPGPGVDPRVLQAEIVSKVRLASRIKVIRSLGGNPPRSPARGASVTGPAPARAGEPALTPFLTGKLIVIGASTGGPQALQTLLGNLPKDFAASVVIVQHMPAAFTQVLAAQLGRHVVLPVKEASTGDVLRPGAVFIAPGDRHLLVRGCGLVEIAEGPKVGGHRPSIDVTMQAAAQVFGPRTTGVVLTGMGNDGVQGLTAIRLRGGRTFAQDAASCVVNSMPTQAMRAGIVDRVAPPGEIARLLCLKENQNHGETGFERATLSGGALRRR
jgi:two-component system chemotaxis response regulator CheB